MTFGFSADKQGPTYITSFDKFVDMRNAITALRQTNSGAAR